MNFKGNLKYIITGSFFFLVVYIFVAAIPMGSELYFEPVWTHSISEQSPLPKAPALTSGKADATGKSEGQPAQIQPAELEPFKLGNTFGYFSADGTIIQSATTDLLSSISAQAWTIYPPSAESTEIYNTDGSLRLTIAASGFVHLDEDRNFLFLPGGNGVSQYSKEGKLLWTREHTAPITAFNSSKAATVMGYADGQLTCVDQNGIELFSFYPGGSDHQVIFGASVSEDGTQVACVSGIDRQRFLLIKITGTQYKITYHTWLEGNLRRQIFVDFDKKGYFAFFETASGLGIVDCRKKSASFVSIDGQLVTAAEAPGDAVFVILTRNGTTCTLSAVENPNHLITKTEFAAKEAFLVLRDNALYLGTDDRISRINIKGL